jgi:deazaflavin-dependent oxidoreductase (nitroreductase family)
MNGNDFVRLALRSPLHVMMGDMLLITVTGRKTGRPITLPVSYYAEGNSLWIISSRDRTWWRNLLRCPDVRLRMHGVDYSGSAELILDEKAVAARLPDYVRRLPMSARALGVQVKNGIADPAGLARVAGVRLFVKICVGG